MISKKYFIFVISQIEKQIIKDRNLTDFLGNGYIDGHLASEFSEPLLGITLKLLSSFFEDNAFKKGVTTWIEWFVFDNDFGKNKFSCYCEDKEYIIINSEDLYDFLILWKGI